MTGPRLTLAEMVAELCDPVRHREHYTVSKTDQTGHTTWFGRDHITTHLCLLDQLHQAIAQSPAAEAGVRPGFTSKPTARLDALDTWTRIDLKASEWVRDLGETDPADTRACIRRLHGLTRSATAMQVNAITADVRRWWAWARIATGWDSPAWSPDNTCPLCGEHGSLRVRLALHIGTCLACAETWDADTIGLLADHIRAESEGQVRRSGQVLNQRRGTGCQCRSCGDPDNPRALVMCPRCGRAACPRAAHHGWPCAGGDMQAVTRGA